MGLRFRRMTLGDLGLAMRLKDQAGWNQTEADWSRFLRLQPDGCFLAERDGVAAGTVTTCVLGRVAWIAMLLVDPRFRRQGIGTRLMQHAIAYLERLGVPSMRLDATPLGRPIYRRLGFVEQYDLLRLEGTAEGRVPPGRKVVPLSADCLDAVAACDRRATGTQRRRLLAALVEAAPRSGRMLPGRESAGGYALFRPGSRAVQLGPAVAFDEPGGIALLDAILDEVSGGPLFVDAPLSNAAAVRWARARGLVPQRTLTRMVRGREVADRPEWIWASSGPEMG